MDKIALLTWGLIIESVAVAAIVINQIWFNIRLTKLWQQLQQQQKQLEQQQR